MKLAIVNTEGRAVDGDLVLSPKELAMFLGTSEGTLAVWRSTGRGPGFEKGSGVPWVGYRVREVARWMQECKPWTRPAVRKRAA